MQIQISLIICNSYSAGLISDISSEKKKKIIIVIIIIRMIRIIVRSEGLRIPDGRMMRNILSNVQTNILEF